MSSVGIAGFENYHKKDGFQTPTRKDLIEHFEIMFGHAPTDEQLEMFHKYLVGKERDVEKVIKVCEQSQSENVLPKEKA